MHSHVAPSVASSVAMPHGCWIATTAALPMFAKIRRRLSLWLVVNCYVPCCGGFLDKLKFLEAGSAGELRRLGRKEVSSEQAWCGALFRLRGDDYLNTLATSCPCLSMSRWPCVLAINTRSAAFFCKIQTSSTINSQ